MYVDMNIIMVKYRLRYVHVHVQRFKVQGWGLTFELPSEWSKGYTYNYVIIITIVSHKFNYLISLNQWNTT